MNPYRYVEIVQGNAFNRGNVIQLPNEIDNTDLDYYGKEVINGFHSVYMHTEDYAKYRNVDGSRRSYDGSVHSKCLYWDMDNEEVEQARLDTIELVEKLLCYDNTNVRIYFSGAKGFHVLYMSPELDSFMIPNQNQLIKKVCTNFASNLHSFDIKIYDKTRIIRTPNSKHPETNLYKIWITYEELKKYNATEIATVLATHQRKEPKKLYNYDPNDEMLSLFSKLQAENNNTSESRGGLFNASEMLDGMKNGFPVGMRNSGMASVAGMLHSRGIDDNFIYSMLEIINNNNQEPLPNGELFNIVKSISRYPVNVNVEEKKKSDISTIKDAGEAWYTIITKSGYTSFGDRFSHLNDRMKLCIPGDVIAIVANSGVGKTTLGLELGNEEAKIRGLYSLLASLEMSKAGIFFRAATIEATELSDNNYIPSSAVAERLLNKTDLRDTVYANWNNLLTVDRGGLSLDSIIEYYKLAQEEYDGKLSNLVIDYAQNIERAEDITYAMGMARRFKEVAKELNTKLFVLMQCNKTMPDDFTEITKTHIEGAGAYYQACDYILSFWKSYEEKNRRLHVALLKDRWGESNYKFDMIREGLKFHSENYVPDRPKGGL